MNNGLVGRLSWQLELFRILNATTRPIGTTQPMLTHEEQLEMRRCHAAGWSAEAYAELLQHRDNHLKMVG